VARMRYLVESLGPEAFRGELVARLEAPDRPGGTALTTAQRGDHVGVHPEKDPDRRSVGCAVPVGRLTGDDLVELARLARTYGDGTVRTTVDQSVVLTGVATARLDALLSEPLLARFSPEPGPFLRGVAACTGTEFCRYAVVETKRRAVALAQRLDDTLAPALRDGGVDRPIRIHVSGCSASCAQPQIADVGLRGAVAKVDDQLEEGFDLGLGGSLGPDAGFIDWLVAAVPVGRLEAAVANVARAYLEGAGPDEDFTRFVRRHDPAVLRALVGGGTM